MSTKPKHGGKTANSPIVSSNPNPAMSPASASAAGNYDASRIFRFEAYALKLRARAAGQ
jgi:hypothetical protein